MRTISPVLDSVALSSRDSMEFFDVARNGSVTVFDEYSDAIEKYREVARLNPDGSWRWRQGYLPILQIGNDCELFADGDELFLCQGKSCSALPSGRIISPDEFSNRADALADFWDNWLQDGLVLPPVSPQADNAWRSALIQARCTFAGRHPLYGALYYRRLVHDSFPPSVLAMVEALLQYNHVQEATGIFRYYFQRFVLPDGRIDYYGPSISEYGAFLWLGAMLIQANPQEASEIANDLQRLVCYCLRLFDRLDSVKTRDNSQLNPLNIGLVSGAPEADEREKQLFYYHNNFQLLRGLQMLAPVMSTHGFPELGREMNRQAICLEHFLRQSFEAKKQQLGSIPYATSQPGVAADIQADMDALYANYRYFPELLETGLLSTEEARALIEFRETHNGEYLSLTHFKFGNDDALDNWPIAAYARGLLEYGEFDRFRLLLENHLHNYMSPDLFIAYEQVFIDGNPRRSRTPACTPALLAFPRMLAWSFSYTKWDGTIV